eukprot:1251372-Ditylum_brightwellii.AAC.1
MDMIDWDALGRNLKKQHLFNQIRLFKSSLLKCKTVPIICSTLIYKLLQQLGLATAPPPAIPSDQLGTILSTAIEEQAEISWE